MELNKKILTICLVLIAISLTFSIGYAMFLKLDEPVFLLNYAQYYMPYEREYYREKEFALQYITNIGDKRRVESISFEETPGIEFYSSEYGSSGGIFFMFNRSGVDEEVYGRYVVRPIFIRFSSEKQFDEIEVNNVKVRFDNGDEVKANIGRIILYTDRDEDDSLEHLTGGSSGGNNYTHIKVKKDITLINVESSLLDEVKDFIELKIGYKDYLDISNVAYNTGDRLLISSTFHKPDDILFDYTLYDIHSRLYYKDNEGNIHYWTIHNAHHLPYKFDFKGILEYLKARGKI